MSFFFGKGVFCSERVFSMGFKGFLKGFWTGFFGKGFLRGSFQGFF